MASICFFASAATTLVAGVSLPPMPPPPPPAPKPSPAPAPPGTRWDCHSAMTVNAAKLKLSDQDLTHKLNGHEFQSIKDCESMCNAIEGCIAVNWHGYDLHCHVLSGATTHEEFVRALSRAKGAKSDTACMRVKHVPVPPPAPARWRNSTTGIHAFLPFDGEANDTAISEYAERIDFVWGASADRIPVWRARNPDVVLAKYIPYTRDPDPEPHTTPHWDENNTVDCRFFRPGCPTALPWWRANKPELILYQCDRQTPAWECFKGEGCRHDSVPLDLSIPATLDYQMAAAVLPAARAGYTAIALDNFEFINYFGACGSFSGPNGSWVQLYNATNPQDDPQYAATVMNWTQQAVRRIHSVGLLVIVNRFIPTFTPQNLAVANLTDGMLAEPGFLSWSPRPSGWHSGPGQVHSTTVPPPKTTAAVFDAQVAFVRHLQRHGKGFFAINGWGEGPDYGLNPSRQPHNISDPVRDRAVRQFAVASFMMTNGAQSALFLSCAQCYGGEGGGIGNLSLWPEYSAPVGHPSAEPSKDASSGVWSRNYSKGMCLVNPANSSRRVALPIDQVSYIDLYGKPVRNGVVALPPASGVVLLKVASPTVARPSSNYTLTRAGV